MYCSHDTIDALVHHDTGSLGMPCRAVAHACNLVMSCVRLRRGSLSTVSRRSRIRSRPIFRESYFLALFQLYNSLFIGRVQCQQYIKLAGEIKQTAYNEKCKENNPCKCTCKD